MSEPSDMTPSLVVIPTERETIELVSACADRGLEIQERALGRIECKWLPAQGAYVASGGLGKAEFGVRTSHLLHYCQPSVVYCVGAAGALAPNANIGDVVVATRTIEHDFRNGFSRKPRPEFPGSVPAIQNLQWGRTGSPWVAGVTVHYGPIASGDEDVVSEERAFEIYESTGALAVAWEGAGGARAAAFHDVPFLEVRGITDRSGADASESYDRNLALAMRNVLKVLLRDD